MASAGVAPVGGVQGANAFLRLSEKGTLEDLLLKCVGAIKISFYFTLNKVNNALGGLLLRFKH